MSFIILLLFTSITCDEPKKMIKIDYKVLYLNSQIVVL